MKQTITVDQLNELSPEAKEMLMNWVDRNIDVKARSINPMIAVAHWREDKNYLLSSGEMIEFLDGKFINFWRGARRDWLIVIDDDKHIVKQELVDCLWEAVKEILEEQE